MKRFLSMIIGLIVSGSVVGQVDRTKAPLPGPAPEIQIGKYQSFELKNGLKVFVVENHKIPRVSFSLLFDNEPILEGDKAGYVSITGQLLRHGTLNRSKAQLDEEIDFIGASLSTSSNGVFASSLTKHKEKLLTLMTDVLYNPSFPAEELEKIRKQTLSGLAAAKEDPGSISGNVSSVLVYGNTHPYGELVTEETVQHITLNDCKQYYDTYFTPGVGYLAIIGDISFKEAKQLVSTYFSKWEGKEIEQPTYKVPQSPDQTYVALVDRPSSVQSVINITYPIQLEPGSPDVIKAGILNQILGGGFSSRLMQNLREDKAYTYGARSSLSSDELVGSFSAGANVRNEVTDSAIHEFMVELEKIVETKVSQEELEAAKASIIGRFARSLEQPRTVASFAINTALYNLPENYYADYLKNVSATTVDDVMEMARKYIKPKNAIITIVGKADDIEEKLHQFGEVRYFDTYGNSYDPSERNKLPEGLTAKHVINQYIEAIGGEAKLKQIASLEMIMDADMLGNAIAMKMIQKAPNKSYMEATMEGNVIMKQVFDGTNASASQMGQPLPIDEQQLEETRIESYLFPELYYETLGVETELIGVEKVNGNDAYAVRVTLPTGSEATHYYAAVSGLKVRESRVLRGPQGEIVLVTDISDYKEVDGVKFPHLIKRPVAEGVNMILNMKSMTINPQVNDDIFTQ